MQRDELCTFVHGVKQAVDQLDIPVIADVEQSNKVLELVINRQPVRVRLDCIDHHWPCTHFVAELIPHRLTFKPHSGGSTDKLGIIHSKMHLPQLVEQFCMGARSGVGEKAQE